MCVCWFVWQQRLRIACYVCVCMRKAKSFERSIICKIEKRCDRFRLNTFSMFMHAESIEEEDEILESILPGPGGLRPCHHHLQCPGPYPVICGHERTPRPPGRNHHSGGHSSHHLLLELEEIQHPRSGNGLNDQLLKVKNTFWNGTPSSPRGWWPSTSNNIGGGMVRMVKKCFHMWTHFLAGEELLFWNRAPQLERDETRWTSS